MKNSSLEEAAKLFVEAVDETTKIDSIDKTELMLNVPNFLEPTEYRENVKILAKRRNNKWKKN